MIKLSRINLIFVLWYMMSSLSAFAGDFQVDMILFADQFFTSNDTRQLKPNISSFITKKQTHIIKANAQNNLHYSLLPIQVSNLKHYEQKLRTSHNYHIISSYSWIIDDKKSQTMQLPPSQYQNMVIDTRLSLIHHSFFQLKATSEIHSKGAPFLAQTVTHKDRLKEGVVYYLDNEHIGMLITIHALNNL